MDDEHDDVGEEWFFLLLAPYAAVMSAALLCFASLAAESLQVIFPPEALARTVIVAGAIVAAWRGEAATKWAARRLRRR